MAKEIEEAIVIVDSVPYDLTDDECRTLLTEEIIYLCPDCGPEIYHLFDDYTSEDLERFFRLMKPWKGGS